MVNTTNSLLLNKTLIGNDKFKPDPEVLGRFASAFGDKSTLTKTQLHVYSKLRWDLHSKYVAWMAKRQYVKEQLIDEIKCYSLTESGMKLLNIAVLFHSLIR